MRWQWPARIIVAAIGVGVAVAMVITAHRRSRPPEPVTSLQEINPNVVAKGGAGRTQFLKAGKNPVNLTSEGSEQDRSGRRFFTGVLIEGLASDRFTVKGDRLDLDGPDDNPSTFNVSGHVVITTSDGLHLETDKASYDNTSGRMNMPGAVTYTKGRISGSALAATYDRDRDVITLLGNARARVEPDTTGKGAADATATRMTLTRGQHTLDMDESARIIGDSQVLTGDKAFVMFTEDERAIKNLELHGSARAMPKAGARGAADQPDMSADNIMMAFQADGLTLQHASLTGQANLALAGASARSIKASSIDMVMAPDGHTLTSLKANERVIVDLAATATSRARTITAASLAATGDDAHGLTSARFDGAPVFTEGAATPAAGAAPASRLVGSGTVLVLKLGGQIDAIETAEFQQHAEFKSGDATAQGDIARYDQARDVVHFLPNEREPRHRPHVENADITVDAWSIDLYTVSQDLFASDNVTTQSRSKPGPAASSGTALFDTNETVSGRSDRLEYTKSSGVATYRGGKVQAKLWQGPQSRIQADRIAYSGDSRDLKAWGHVDSTWLFDAAPSEKPAAPRVARPDGKLYDIQAETLVYDDAARVATFTAPEVTLKTDDGEIKAGVLTLRLAAESRALDELRAEGRAWSSLSGGYETVSNTLVYQVEEEIYILRGKANSVAQVKSPKKDDAPKPDPARAICTVTTGLLIEIRRKEGSTVQTGTSQANRTTIEQLCTVPLRRSEK